MRINMSNVRPMGIAAKEPHVRYSAAYPTGRERMLEPRYGCAEDSFAFFFWGGRTKCAQRAREGIREN